MKQIPLLTRAFAFRPHFLMRAFAFRPHFLLHLLLACSAFAQRVPWVVETTQTNSNQAGDPTFLSVASRPQLIVGTDPAAIGVYLWAPGQFPEILPVGLVNAADARDDVFVVASSALSAVLVFQVGADGGINQFGTGLFSPPSPGQIALARTGGGGFEVVIDDSSSLITRYGMSFDAGQAQFALIETITVSERPSGLAIDERSGQIYVAQPTRGVVVIERGGAQRLAMSIDAGTLGTLVGGVDLFLAADGGALVFSAAPNEGELKVHTQTGDFVAALQIGEPDGGAVIAARPRFVDVFESPVPLFPRGVLIVHDEFGANYKFVSLAAVDAVMPLPEPFVTGGTLPSDGGLVTDAGVSDGGTTDGGSGGGAGGGSGAGGAGGSGSPSRPAPGIEPPPSCGCSGGPFALLPALLALWCIRRRRVSV
jgi:hypothetical protein